MMKPVEIIDNGDGSYAVRVYEIVVFVGTREECESRAALE